ncbi:response regulator transcription factor [Rhizobiaceae sp. 2RAB30]
MSERAFRVHLIDDDASILAALSRLLSHAGYGVETYSDAETFLARHDPATAGCAVIDLSLPGKDGFAVQEVLEACGWPVIFLTGKGDIPASVKAMKGGALDFLVKPVAADCLLAAVGEARRIEETRRQEFDERRDFERRFANLTPRETQVLGQVAAGRLNKQIAGDLGTVEKTIKVHRSRMMEKMGVRNVADLVRMVQRFNP